MRNRSGRLKRTYLAAVLRTGLAVFLLISSAAIVFTTARNFRSVQLLSTRALESTALALSSSAETALRAMGNKADTEIREILSDRGRGLRHDNNKRGQDSVSHEP
jgi:hypothetical protein